jgi:hypothetical protein
MGAKDDTDEAHAQGDRSPRPGLNRRASMSKLPLRDSVLVGVRLRWGVRVCRFPLAILLLANLVTLLPLASADPSDPTWLVGIYDEVDGDSVVWLIERMELRIHPEAASEGKPDSGLSRPVRATEALRCPSDAPPAVISLVASPSRAPPLREGDGLVRSPSFQRLGTRKPVPAIRPFDPSHVKHSGETGTRVDPRSPLAVLVLRASPL